MRSNKIFAFLASILVLSMLLAACAPQAAPTAAPQTEAPAATAAPAATEPPAPAKEPVFMTVNVEQVSTWTAQLQPLLARRALPGSDRHVRAVDDLQQSHRRAGPLAGYRI